MNLFIDIYDIWTINIFTGNVDWEEPVNEWNCGNHRWLKVYIFNILITRWINGEH